MFFAEGEEDIDTYDRDRDSVHINDMAVGGYGRYSGI